MDIPAMRVQLRWLPGIGWLHDHISRWLVLARIGGNPSQGLRDSRSPSVQEELIDMQKVRRRRAVRVKPVHPDAR